MSNELENKLIRCERCAIAYSDIIANQVIAMQAMYIAYFLERPASALEWLTNTLSNTDNLPDLSAAQTIGGAQAWFDLKTAELNRFRTENPPPKITKA